MQTLASSKLSLAMVTATSHEPFAGTGGYPDKHHFMRGCVSFMWPVKLQSKFKSHHERYPDMA